MILAAVMFLFNLLLAAWNVYWGLNTGNAVNWACLPLNIGCAFWMMMLMVRYR